MPLVNYLKVHGADLVPLLEPGERLIDMGPYREPLIGDESQLARTLDELSPRMRQRVRETGQPPLSSDRFVQGFDVFAGGLQANPDRIDRWLGGVSGVGAADSIAGRIWRVAKERDAACYAVTDRRLVLLAEPRMGTFKVVFDVPRAQVASAARRGKLLFQRGRVEVRFVDGSMKAWTPGMIFAGRARSLVAALTGTTTDQ